MLKLVSLRWILSTNDQVVLANFLPKKSGLAFFFAKKRKLARHQNWQKHEKCDFGQLVLIC